MQMLFIKKKKKQMLTSAPKALFKKSKIENFYWKMMHWSTHGKLKSCDFP